MPQTPQPPANMISPYGSTAPFNPTWTSFLPSNPNAVANGLTPQMLAGINAGPSFAPPRPQPAAPGAPTSYQQMLQMAQQMPGGMGGGNNNAGPFSAFFPNLPRPGQGASPADRSAYGDAMKSARRNALVQLVGGGGRSRAQRGGHH